MTGIDKAREALAAYDLRERSWSQVGAVNPLADPLRATIAAHDALAARVVELEAALRPLIEHVCTVVPYVEATVALNNAFESQRRPGWVEIHRGRAVSSARQLACLERDAVAARRALTPGGPRG